MKPPALYRSVGFWLGLFVLVFLMWAWVDATERSVGGVLALKDSRPASDANGSVYFNGVTIGRGRIGVFYTSVTKPDPHLTVRRGPLRFDSYSTEFRWISSFAVGSRRDTTVTAGAVRSYSVKVPMLLIVGSYLLLWIGVMWWRRRR